MWIGATDRIKEGDWKWTDGNPWSFTKWGKGEGNNKNLWNTGGIGWYGANCGFGGCFQRPSDGEDCAILANKKISSTTKFKGWLDTPCNKYAKRHFVCARSTYY